MNTRRFAVSAETDYSYVDKTTGKQLSFLPRTDEAMVTFQGRATSDTLNEVLQDTPLLSVSQGINLERSFAAVYVRPDQDMEEATRALEVQPEIANSLPVMIDENGLSRYFLPDEFTVQFREGTSRERAEEIIQERGSQIITEQRTPGYYTLAVSEGKGLFEIIRESQTWLRWSLPSQVR